MLTQAPSTANLIHTLATEWTSKDADVQQTLNAALDAVSTWHQAGAEALQHAQAFRTRVDQDPTPSRRQLLILREYLAVLEQLHENQVEVSEICQQLVDDIIVPIGFSASVTALFNMHTDRARQEIADTDEIVNSVKWTIINMEKLPGLNPRKVPLFEDAQGRHIKSMKIHEEAKKPPIEFQQPLTPGNWQCAKTLGGGMSQAFLWVDVDDNGNIRRRVVRKDTPVDAARWADATRWHGDMRNPANRMPLEYYCQAVLQDRPETQYVVLALKCEVDLQKLLYRLYLPLCPYGNLHGLINRYRDNDILLPEPFLWRVFDVLAETGVIMEKGGFIDQPDDWQEIVHRDLKPTNIFLDTHYEQSYPRYPVPKLADFGLAFHTWPDDSLNPTIWNFGSGTPGYRAPEQLPFIDEETRERVDAFKLLAHTNVWGVGAIMWSLAHRHNISPGTEPDYLPHGSKEMPVGNKDTQHLSQDLMNAIRACMRFDPADRITFQKLHANIQTFFETHKNDEWVGQYLHKAKWGDREENYDFDLVGWEDSEYKLGFAFEGPEWGRDAEMSEPSAAQDAGADEPGADESVVSGPGVFQVPDSSGSGSGEEEMSEDEHSTQ